MPAILDPYYSRPIDVHRWSDHPEVAAIVENIWGEHFSDMAVNRPGPRPRTPFKEQLKVVLLDCYVAWMEDPELSIGVSMNVNAYDTRSRYNALHISKHIIKIIERLHEVGLLVIAKGSYGGEGVGANRTTRIRPSDQLQAIFAGGKVKRDDIHRIDTEECVILRGEDGRLVEYEDTEQTNLWREELRAYNRVLANSFIDLSTAEEAHIVAGEKSQHIGRHYQFVRRVFSRGDWGLNGRFYGGWWQQLGSKDRSNILIDDQPTVEVDFNALHVQILSAEANVVLEGDPYALPRGTVPGVPEALQRKLVKRLVLTALNARDRRSAFASFRDDWPQEHVGKTLINNALEQLMEAFLERLPHLRDAVFADQGIRLMNIDSQIIERVHRHFTEQGVPVLSVHDSCIVDYTRVGELKRIMADASEAVVGRPLPVSANGVGLDEIEPDKVEDLKAWRDERVIRCDGYRERLGEWEKLE